MKILIYDKLQDASGVPDAILTPALSDIYTADVTFTATFDAIEKVNCVGIGYTDATEIEIYSYDDDETQTITISKDAPYHNGLYALTEINSDVFIITHDGTFIGRVGLGEYRTLGTAPSKEIGFYTTEKSRETLSGQVIPGAGGYSGRRFNADVRYKIDEDVYNDIESAYAGQISKGFPYFLNLTEELHKLPENMRYFYANTDKPLSLLQSSTYDFLYSYKFNFYERF